MSGRTSIEWTDFSVNPIRARHRATGRVGHICEKVSAGCKNCYSSTMQRRFGMPPFEAAYHDYVGAFFDEEKCRDVIRRRTPTKWFWCDMTDLFGAWVPDEWIDRCVATMAWAHQHIHQVLTKRPGRMLAYSAGLAVLTRQERGVRLARAQGYRLPSDTPGGADWPLPNVWLGVSVEDQKTADERIPLLLDTSAAFHWVSYEPALEPVDFSRFLASGDSDNPERGSEHSRTDGDVPAARAAALRQQRPRWDKSTGHGQGGQGAERPGARNYFDWIVVGGESGPAARPFDLAWARQTIAQGKAAGVPIFVKQLGAKPFERIEDQPPTVDGWQTAERGKRWFKFKDRKGGSMEEWPEDLRVREYPA